jgi:dihydrofolate reductase
LSNAKTRGPAECRIGALEPALEAAEGRDVRVGGGPATIQQYLRAGFADEMHVVFVPILIGGGERLFDHLDGPIGYDCVELTGSTGVAHAIFARASS